MKSIAFIFLLFTAAGDAPRSPLAVKAQKAYEAQLQRLQAQREQALRDVKNKNTAAIKEARDEYTKQLRPALDAAIKAKDLEEANRIDAAIKASAPADTTTPPATPDSAGDSKRAKSGVPDGVYILDVCKHGESPAWYQTEWTVRDGRAAETKYTDTEGSRVHRNPDWRPIKHEEGSFRITIAGWGYDLWHPLANGSGYALERFETRGNVKYTGVVRFDRKLGK